MEKSTQMVSPFKRIYSQDFAPPSALDTPHRIVLIVTTTTRNIYSHILYGGLTPDRTEIHGFSVHCLDLLSYQPILSSFEGFLRRLNEPLPFFDLVTEPRRLKRKYSSSSCGDFLNIRRSKSSFILSLLSWLSINIIPHIYNKVKIILLMISNGASNGIWTRAVCMASRNTTTILYLHMVDGDGVEPPEPEDNRFTVCPAPTYGISIHIEKVTIVALERPPSLTAHCWWSIPDSNRSPQACKASALPDELIPQTYMNE